MPSLSTEEIEALTHTLKNEPSDFETRFQLIKHYWRFRYCSEECAQSHAELVFWLIEHDPGNTHLSDPYCSFCNDGSVSLEHAIDLYQKAVGAFSQEAPVIFNFAWLSYYLDLPDGESLFLQCCELEPENPYYYAELGRYYSLISPAPDKEGYLELAGKTLYAYEQACQFYDAESRFYKLGDLARAALAYGDHEKAGEYAKELLEAAASYPKNWNYGNALHHGNIILGKVALSRDDLAAAGEHLLDSAKYSEGSPQLNTFGPDLILAQELLNREQFDIAKQYLETCSQFWKSDRAARVLSKACPMIERREIPDLESLIYR